MSEQERLQAHADRVEALFRAGRVALPVAAAFEAAAWSVAKHVEGCETCRAGLHDPLDRWDVPDYDHACPILRELVNLVTDICRQIVTEDGEDGPAVLPES